MKEESVIKQLHPVTVFLYTGTLFVLAMVWTNPLWLVLLFITITVNLLSLSAFKVWKRLLTVSICLAIILGLTNAFFSRRGETTIWIGPALPFIGSLRLTLEALLFGLNSGLKVIVAISIFCLYQEMINQDEAMIIFSRIAPKSALTMILAVLLVPRLRRDLTRIRDVMSIRGAGFDTRGLVRRINASRPLLHVLLFSALEGSWDIASTLSCRAFGSGKRSFHKCRDWLPRDWLVASGALMALSTFVIGLRSGTGFYNFYPSLGPIIKSADIPFIIVVFCSLSLSYLLGWSFKRWRFLKSRI